MNHFDDIRNQIDIARQTYLNKDVLAIGDKHKAIRNQDEMIDEVDLFQRQCLEKLKTIQIDPIYLEDCEHRFKSLNMADKRAVLNLENEVYCLLFQTRKLLLNNKGFICLSISDSECLHSNKEYKHGIKTLLGILIIMIEDEFLYVLSGYKFSTIE